MDDLEMDMPKWVEEMKEVLVETAWIGPCARLRCRELTHGWISKIRSRLLHVELRTELRSRLRRVTSVAIAKLPFAWAHAIEGRTAGLVVLVGQERPDQLGCAPGTGDLERSDSAMVAQEGSFWSLKN